MKQEQVRIITKLLSTEGAPMNKGNLIKKYIGEGIAPFKFEYVGYQGDSWIFEKKFGRITQTISIYAYRFDKSMLSFELYTDARETGMVTAVDIEGTEFNSNIPGFWKYEDNEESLIEVLNRIKEVLIKKGMRILKDLSVEPEIIADNQMVRNVYFKHDELCEKFMRENQIEVTGYDPENINKWFDVIEERVKVLQQGTYADAKEELTEMASFLGVQLVKYMEGKWLHFVDDDYESCGVKDMKSEVASANCLNLLLGGYSKNGMGWTKDTFLDIYESREK